MDLAKTNNENFNPTPKLKSSPMPILFISFYSKEDKCNYCRQDFSMTILKNQKYCKNCLTWYMKYLTDNEMYLDVHITTNNSPCNEHEPRDSNFVTNDIQKWCVTSSEVLYFRQ